MEKIYGSPGRQDGLYKIGRDRWELIYGFGKDSEDDETGWNWRQRFDHRPAADEIRECITGAIREECARRLHYGLQWRGMEVEYTESLKSDLTGILVAVQGGLMQFPLEVSLGVSSDGLPIVCRFEDARDLGELAARLTAHAAQVGKEERELLTGLDLGVYESGDGPAAL
ncbi:MAG: hypothetical protein K2O24_09205 [Muribaculaceae bacterium]|nr:hypothetical protein [Muribaculaceae bacterium]